MIKSINLISKELFYVLTGSLVIFVFFEVVWPSAVLAYINLNWVLIFWLLVGIVILITDEDSA